MSPSRRDLLAAGGGAALAAILPPAGALAAAPTTLLLTDDPRGSAPHGAIVLAPGRFVDDVLVAALPPADYLARLSPANALLLREVLRSRRVAADTCGDAVTFTLRPAVSRAGAAGW